MQHAAGNSSLFPPVSRRLALAEESPRKPPGTATRAVHRGAKVVALSDAMLASVPRPTPPTESNSVDTATALVVVTPRSRAELAPSTSQSARQPLALPELRGGDLISSRVSSPRGGARTSRYGPIDTNASPLLSCWPSTTGGGQSTSTKSQFALELETILQRDAAPSLGWLKRGECLVQVSRELKRAFPSFASVFTIFEGIISEMSVAVKAATDAAESEIQQRSQALLDEKDRFYRSAMMDLLREKRRFEKAAFDATAEVNTLRQQRDDELNAVKLELVEAIRGLSQDDHESHHLRQLLSTVYRANSELREHVSNLELALKKATADKNEPYIPPRFLPQQVNLEFIEASEAEMQRCRLSTQRALIDSAVTTRSALHAKADSAQAENVELKERLAEANERMLELQKQLHHMRYESDVLPASVFYALRQDRIHSVDPQALLPRSSQPEAISPPPLSETPVSPSNSVRVVSPSNSVRVVVKPNINLDGPDLLRPECYTPRPSVPFEVQTVLGVDVSSRTRTVVEAVCDIALRQQRAATETAIAMRRLQVISSWMEPSLVEHCAALAAKSSDVDTLPFLSTAPESEWATLPHFLRTSITPHVTNQALSERDVAILAREFLADYETFANAAREIQTKMIAPKPVPLWERRKANLLAVLDVNKPDLADRAVAVPRGYAVTAFIRAVLMRRNGGRNPSELEMATLAYNFWHAVKRFRFVQPACEAFLLFVDGRVPIESFTWGDRILLDLYESLNAVDTTHSGAVNPKAIVNALLMVYQKDPGEVWRDALHAVTKTAKTHRLPMTDRLPIVTVTGAENTASGASDLTCFIRRDMIRRFEAFYETLEDLLRGAVKESTAMKSLCILRIDDINTAASSLDAKILSGELEAPIQKGNFKLTVERVLARIPRLNASAHLPRAPAAPTTPEEEPLSVLHADESSAPPTSPNRLVSKKKKGGGKANVAKNQIAVLLGDNSNDQSLVEWYVFCAALRSTCPVIADIASPLRALEGSSMSPSASVKAMDPAAAPSNSSLRLAGSLSGRSDRPMPTVE